MTVSEREFLKRRLELVEEQLGGRDPIYMTDEDGNIHLIEEIERGPDVPLQRERRILYKLLTEVPEGRVLATLTSWRKRLAAQLAEHHMAQRHERDTYNTRLFIRDRKGYPWVIDDRFLALLGDLAERLTRWLASDEEEELSTDSGTD